MLNFILTCVMVLCCLIGIAASAQACDRCGDNCPCEQDGGHCDCKPGVLKLANYAPRFRKQCGPNGCSLVPIPDPATNAPPKKAAPPAAPATRTRKRLHVLGRPHFR